MATTIHVQINQNKPFKHMNCVMVIPGKITYKEFIRRLNIKLLWRYLLITNIGDINKSVMLITQDKEDIVPEISKVTVYEISFQPILPYNKIQNAIEKLKEKTAGIERVDHVAVWFNYDVNNEEPIIIIMMYKNEGIWNTVEKTSFSFEEVENAIVNKKFFTTLTEGYERFFEIKECINAK